MLAHGLYVRMLDVCVTLACVMWWHVNRARLHARQVLMSILYASYQYVFYATGQGSMSGGAQWPYGMPLSLWLSHVLAWVNVYIFTWVPGGARGQVGTNDWQIYKPSGARCRAGASMCLLCMVWSSLGNSLRFLLMVFSLRFRYFLFEREELGMIVDHIPAHSTFSDLL